MDQIEAERLYIAMKWLIAIFCIVAVASADPWYGPPPPCGPPPEPECPPEVIEEPVPPPVVGMLTQIINVMIAEGAEITKVITALIAKNNQDLIDFNRQNGGPGFNDCAKIHFFARQANQFWKDVVDVTADQSHDILQAFNAALTQFEDVFRLVIDQPNVRSWLRELRDIPRLIQNLTDEAIQARRAQWFRLSQIYAEEFRNMVRAGLCSSPDYVQDRFYRILQVGLDEAADVLAQLKVDLETIRRRLVAHGAELSQNIYEVEILALKYFVA